MMRIEPNNTNASDQLKVVLLDRAKAPAWDSFVEQQPAASNFHRLVWRAVLEEAFGHPTYYLMAEADGVVSGILPLVLMRSRLFGAFMVSMPIFNYGGVLTTSPMAESLLIDHAIEIAKAEGARFIELRHAAPRNDARLLEQVHKVAMVSDLPVDADALWNSFKPKLRSQIRRAEKEDVRVAQGGPELVPDFYKAFAINMRDLGTPVFSPSFFYAILNRPDCHATIFNVYINGQIAGGALTTHFKDMFEVTHASVIRKYNPLSPNMFLYWTMLKHACQRRFKRFNFGRSPIDSGTYRFKAQWGARPQQLYWHYWLPEGRQLSLINPRNPKYRLAIKLWQQCPVWLTRIIGPHIVRAIP